MMPTDPQMVFGNSVRVSRNLLGISQETLAERSELHRTYISDVECGTRNPSLKTIIRIAHALEVSISALIPPELEHWKINEAYRDGAGRNLMDILLVEDSPDDVELTLQCFKQARFANRVHVVSDGRDALDYVFCRGKFQFRSVAPKPLLIILDLSQPRLRGLEVLRQLRRDARTCNLPVVILSASESHADIVECRRLGVIAFITKPFNWQGFYVAIKKCNLNWVLVQSTNVPGMEEPT